MVVLLLLYNPRARALLGGVGGTRSWGRCRRGNISIGRPGAARQERLFNARSQKRGLINVAAAAAPKLISAPSLSSAAARLLLF